MFDSHDDAARMLRKVEEIFPLFPFLFRQPPRDMDGAPRGIPSFASPLEAPASIKPLIREKSIEIVNRDPPSATSTRSFGPGTAMTTWCS